MHLPPLFQAGPIIPGLTINGKAAPYPVLNERAVRAGAGLIFAAGMFAFFQALYLEQYLYLQILVAFLLLDFSIKVLLNPQYSPLSLVANLIVRKQTPEYVGAIQKRFAWSIGLALATTMAIVLFGLGIVGPINLVICAICLVFMFMESAFGICVGCKVYNGLIRFGVIAEPAYKPACAGNVCAVE